MLVLRSIPFSSFFPLVLFAHIYFHDDFHSQQFVYNAYLSYTYQGGSLLFTPALLTYTCCLFVYSIIASTDIFFFWFSSNACFRLACGLNSK
ncbi:hypothetical protein C8Q75DRAFT_91398 [Abortiporus biennis]|nr:hypothetical protein C8Q75DRAFT_91398 [Abortiporus biennis]